MRFLLRDVLVYFPSFSIRPKVYIFFCYLQQAVLIAIAFVFKNVALRGDTSKYELKQQGDRSPSAKQMAGKRSVLFSGLQELRKMQISPDHFIKRWKVKMISSEKGKEAKKYCLFLRYVPACSGGPLATRCFWRPAHRAKSMLIHPVRLIFFFLYASFPELLAFRLVLNFNSTKQKPWNVDIRRSLGLALSVEHLTPVTSVRLSVSRSCY